MSPEFQPNGTLSSQVAQKMINRAFSEGMSDFEWVHKRSNGEEFYMVNDYADSFSDPSLWRMDKDGNVTAVLDSINGEYSQQSTLIVAEWT